MLVLSLENILNRKMNNKRLSEVESYILFKNVDDSILKLNPILKNKGYKFISLDLSELEANFSSLYDLPSNFEKKMMVQNKKTKVVNSVEFLDTHQSHPLGGITYDVGGKTIFLKKTKNSKLDTINLNIEELQKIGIQNQNIQEPLLRILRLFKNGDITSPSEFIIDKTTRHIFSKQSTGFQYPITSNIYSIIDEDVKKIEILMNKNLKKNVLTEFAEVYFEGVYELYDSKMKFINLITALESLFNRSDSQISHIIARHLSIIISSNIEEFHKNYKRIKKLYNYRSQIIHGQKINLKENINDLINELQNLTRSAILFCLELKLNKDELFDYLNSKGY